MKNKSEQSISDTVISLYVDGFYTSTSQIRKLDNLGLINIKRKGSSCRLITSKVYADIKTVLVLRAIGIGINTIKQFMKSKDMSVATEIVRLIDGHIKSMKEVKQNLIGQGGNYEN